MHFADKLAHVFQNWEEAEIEKVTENPSSVKYEAEQDGGGANTIMSLWFSELSRNPEIPEGIFNGDKYKFWVILLESESWLYRNYLTLSKLPSISKPVPSS